MFPSLHDTCRSALHSSSFSRIWSSENNSKNYGIRYHSSFFLLWPVCFHAQMRLIGRSELSITLKPVSEQGLEFKDEKASFLLNTCPKNLCGVSITNWWHWFHLRISLHIRCQSILELASCCHIKTTSVGSRECLFHAFLDEMHEEILDRRAWPEIFWRGQQRLCVCL